MRKISRDCENPIDNINIDMMDKTCGFFKKLHFTPNGITTLSLLFGILSLYFLYHYKVVLFGITYYISYLFDCLDGHYARKYKMVSKFGDFYDHIKDVIVVFGIFSVLYFRYCANPKACTIFIIYIVVISILMIGHLGCQENIYKKKESATLSFSKTLCENDPISLIKFTRWFGCGSWIILLIIGIFYLNMNRIRGL